MSRCVGRFCRRIVVGVEQNTAVGRPLGLYRPRAQVLVIPSADFNGDNNPDFVIFKPITRQTAIVFLHNNVFINAVSGLTLPSGWTLLSH
jgi:hypothetical protein